MKLTRGHLAGRRQTERPGGATPSESDGRRCHHFGLSGHGGVGRGGGATGQPVVRWETDQNAASSSWVEQRAWNAIASPACMGNWSGDNRKEKCTPTGYRINVSRIVCYQKNRNRGLPGTGSARVSIIGLQS